METTLLWEDHHSKVELCYFSIYFTFVINFKFLFIYVQKWF